MERPKRSNQKDLTGQVEICGKLPAFTGNYSCVYRGKLQSRNVAVKIIKAAGTDHATRRKLRREREVWEALENPNILPFYGYAHDEDFQPFGAFISPWCSNGDVARFLGEHGPSLPHFEKMRLWEGVVRGVAYLHERNPPIIHGDLKPGNVLMWEDGTPKICDFGLVRIFLEEGSSGTTTTSEHTGTERFLAPELVSPDAAVVPTMASDIYALGCLGLVIIYAQLPFSRHRNNLQGRVIADIKKGIPPAPRSAARMLFLECSWMTISTCWERSHHNRPRASKLQERAFCTHYLTSKPLSLILQFSLEGLLPEEQGKEHDHQLRRAQFVKRMCQVSRTWCAHAIPLLLQDTKPYGHDSARAHPPAHMYRGLFSPNDAHNTGIFEQLQNLLATDYRETSTTQLDMASPQLQRRRNVDDNPPPFSSLLVSLRSPIDVGQDQKLSSSASPKPSVYTHLRDQRNPKNPSFQARYIPKQRVIVQAGRKAPKEAKHTERALNELPLPRDAVRKNASPLETPSHYISTSQRLSGRRYSSEPTQVGIGATIGQPDSSNIALVQLARPRSVSMTNLAASGSADEAAPPPSVDVAEQPLIVQGEGKPSVYAAVQPLIVQEEGKPPTHYQIGNIIGRGSFSPIYRALNLNTGKMFTVKRIGIQDISEDEISNLMKKVDVLKRLSHPRIVKYEGMVRSTDTLSVIMEYVENGSLCQFLKAFGKLGERLVANYVRNILEGLHYLHTSHVVHCDLKAANVLTTRNGNVKLSGFGVSLDLVGKALQDTGGNMAGIVNWMAPEVIELKGPSTASDIWSLGCTIVELLTGHPPYYEILNVMSVMFRMVEDDPPIPEACSPLMVDFLKQCFQKDPEHRPSAEVLFEHQWLQKDYGYPKGPSGREENPFLRRVEMDRREAPPLYADEQHKANSIRGAVANSRLALASPLPSSPRGIAGNHSFIKTTFGRAVPCRVCRQSVKRSAVTCEKCSLIAHSRCAPDAPARCDIPAQLSPHRSRVSAPARLAQELSTPTQEPASPAVPNNISPGNTGGMMSPQFRRRPPSSLIATPPSTPPTPVSPILPLDSPNANRLPGPPPPELKRRKRIEARNGDKPSECTIQ